MNFTTLGSSYKWNRITFVLLCLAYFTQHSILKVRPCCNMCQEFPSLLRLNYYSLYGYIYPYIYSIPYIYIFHCMDIPLVWIYHWFSIDLWVASNLLALVSNAATNMGLQTSLPVSASNSLGYIPGLELFDHMVILFLICWGTALLFFIVAAPCYIPTGSAQRFQLLSIITNTCYIFLCIFDGRHPNGCEVVFNCDSDLYFPND